jgi:hypothetical protein
MLKFTYVILLLLLPISIVSAQDTLLTTNNNKWHFLVEPYLMFPNMQGDLGLGDLPDASIDLNPGDIFNHLQIGGMLYLEGRNDNWAATSDFLYMKLNQDISPNKPINSGTATMSQTVWELAGMYKLNAWLEVGAGARLYNITADAELKIATLPPGTETTQSKSINETWVDPIIVTRLSYFTETNWIAELRADIGGFGIGSKFAWQIQADFGYRFSKLFHATIGYRDIDVNYENGNDSERFLYNIATFGPVIRLRFNF